MDNVIGRLSDLLLEGLPQRKQSTYSDMRSGRLNFRVGFPITTDQKHCLPSVLLQQANCPDYGLSSSAVCAQLNFRNIMECEKSSIDHRISDHITEVALKEASLRLLQSKKGQLRQIENKLSQIIEEDRVDVNTFSQNTLTNCCSYNLLGQIVDMHTISIEAASKRYTEEEVLEHVPHPVRTQRKRKLVAKQGQRKSKEQVLEELNILNGMFSIIEEGGLELETVSFKDVIDLVSLKDGADYNDLWQSIMKDLSLDKEQQNRSKRMKVSQQMGDQEFNKIIDRIVKEATQYEQDNFEEEEEKQQPESIQKESNQQPILQEAAETKAGFESIKIQKKVQSSRGKNFQFAIEDNTDLSNFYDILPKEKFAIQYKFELDEFQKRSILHLERKESVFVAAHTSAGKTVVAEYGIALAMRHKRKVIYTSPIKALSNQKYRQLSKLFDSVGIVTGDVSMNPQASCVIMTTEILRNNLYRGAEMIRDIEWVIFDEVHYINNADRGVVWEETIIMLPDHIGLIMLSATVPNYMEFANWVGRTKRRMVYVMKTLHRPVPLQHSLYILGKFHVIKEPNGPFLKQDYNQIKSHINSLARNAEGKKEEMKELKKKKIQEKGFYNDNRKEQRLKLITKSAIDKFIKKITKTDLETAEGKEDFRVLEQLIAHCHKKNLLPCVVFTFSKKKINALAQKIYLFDLTNRSEKSKIRQLISHALSNLKPEDRQLPQFQFLTNICMNGYAIHHGDLLPLAKEIVELLFSDGLIKVLFATETFAMGINMPTKTVIYHTIKKVSGSNGGQRFLNSSEYVQMSGRAGRRGLDQKGNVIIIAKNPGNLPDAEEMVRMMDHPGQSLVSKFKVTYQIILNLYNSKDINVQQMMRQSFMEDPKFKQFTTNIKKVKELKHQYEELSEFQCPFNKLGTRLLVEQYVSLAKSLREGNADRFWRNEFKKIALPRFALLLGHNNEVQLCLLLRMDKGNIDRILQVLVVNKIYKGLQVNKQDREEEEAKLGVKKRIILQFENKNSTLKDLNGAVEGTDNQYQFNVYWVTPEQILEVYREKLNFKKQFDDSKRFYSQIAVQLLSPPKNLAAYHAQLAQEGIYKEFAKFECHKCEFKEKHLHQQKQRTKTKKQVSITASRINTNELGLMGSFEGMLKLLNQFKFISDNSLILKGRVARQVDIYVAQVIIQAVLDPLNPAEIAALMSAFVCDYKPRANQGEQQTSISPFSPYDTYTAKLETAIQKTYKIVSNIIKYEINNQAYINPLGEEELLITILNFHLVDTVYKWAVGFDFAEAKQDTKAPEGTIVRAIMRLNMLMSNIKSVCRILGNSQLEAKIDLAIENIKRDIVFCQSLYLST